MAAFPDLNTMLAATLYGQIVASNQKPTVDRLDVEGEEPTKQPIASCWKEAKPEHKEGCLKAVRFLASYTNSNNGNLNSVDRDAACEAVAGVINDTALARMGVNYRILVESYISARQAVG